MSAIFSSPGRRRWPLCVGAVLMPVVLFLVTMKGATVLTILRLGIVPAFAIWWWNPAQINAAVQTLIGVGLALATGFVGISGILDKRRHEAMKADTDAKIARDKAIEEAHRESITAQLKAAQADREEIRVQLTDELGKMRKTNHDILDQFNTRTLENAELRMDLAGVRKDYLAIAEQLRVANEQIRKLTAELHEANAQVARLSAAVDRSAEATVEHSLKVERAVQGVADRLDVAPPPGTPPA